MPLEYDHKTATLVKDLFELAPKSGMDPQDLRDFLDFVVQLVLVGYGGRKFYFAQVSIKASAEEIGLLAELFSHLGLGAIREDYFSSGDRPPQSDALLFGMNSRNKGKGVIWGQIVSKKGTRWTARNERDVQKALGMTVLSSEHDWADDQLDRLAVSVWFEKIQLFTQVVPTRDEKEVKATTSNAIKLCDGWKKIWDEVTGGLGLTWTWSVATILRKKNSSWSSASAKIIHTAD